MSYILPTYKRFNKFFTRGRGVFLYDKNGNKYLDMLSGISVLNLGHCHSKVVGALKKQAGELWHTSNLYNIIPQEKLAKKLADASFADQAFFCNSGAEANEAAIKLARKYSYDNFKKGRHEIVTFTKSFHGRTLGTIAATGQDKVKKGFDPIPKGFLYAEYNNIDDLRKKVSEKTCAIMLEIIQGEGGVNIIEPNFLKSAASIAKAHKALVIVDEIQTGMGRTGKMFAYENYDFKPDIITLAKALGNGFPIGAMLTTREIGKSFSEGAHGSTFGGNFLACAVACEVIDVIKNEKILSQTKKMSKYLLKQLSNIANARQDIVEVRGIGLMIGIEFKQDVGKIVEDLLEKGIIVGKAGDNVIRLLPPLIIAKKDIDRFIEVFSAKH